MTPVHTTMKGFTAVFTREILERRLLALFALLGLVPLVLPYLASMGISDPRDCAVVALVIAGTSSLLLALVLGATAMVPELADRRLGFYFGRPIGAGAIWAGKLGAALAWSLATALLVLTPTVLVRGRALAAFSEEPAWAHPVLWLLILGLAVLAAHGVALAARARSPWLMLDVAGLVGTAALAWKAGERLFREGAFSFTDGGTGALERLRAALPMGLGLALLAATVLQVSRGRTDLRRAHRILSLTLWGLAFATVLAADGYSRWVVAAGPEDLVSVKAAVAAPAGDWLALTGPTAHRSGFEARFLFNPASGRYQRLGLGSFGYGTWPRFSADGRRAVWTEAPEGPRSPTRVLAYADLDRPRSSPVRTEIPIWNFRSLALSPDGRRIAQMTRDRLLVHEAASGKLLASVELGGGGAPGELAFPVSGLVRAYRSLPSADETHWQTGILELDLASSAAGRDTREPAHLVTTGRLSTPLVPEVSLSSSADGERLIYATTAPGQGWGLLLADARTGRTLADLTAAGSGQGHGRPRFLRDGRIAFLAGSTRAPRSPEVFLLDRDGAPLARWPAPGARWLGEGPLPGSLLVASAPTAEPSAQWRLDELDIATGARRTIARGLAPASSIGEGRALAADNLFFAPGYSLVWLDPATGRRRTLVE